MNRVAGALAVLFLAAHLAHLPSTLEDIDSVNFAMGVRDFDVAQHQPHPPGYPVFIALGKISTAALASAGVAAPDVRGLAVLSAIGGAALVLLVFLYFRAIDGDALRALVASVLTMCAPLVWFNAARPLSDLAGLAAAFAALAALVWAIGWNAAPDDSRTTSTRRAAIGGALLAGLAIGFRSQMAMLTGPAFLIALVAVRRHRLVMTASAIAGVFAWAIPLVWLNGGPAGYLNALGSQAGEDFAGVVMLWTNPSPRVAFVALLDTFVRPWDSPVLGGTMLALAAAGAAVLAVNARRTLLVVLLTFAPYAVFHLLFQEPPTTRYALPLVPVVAFLVAVTLTTPPVRVALPVAGGLAIASLSLAVPATSAFSSQPSPIFALLSEAQTLQARGAQPAVAMHRRVFTESRRARAYAGGLPGTMLPATRDYEWLELTRQWKEGRASEAWFIADPRRTDLALIDRANARTRKYRWPFKGASYAGGTRPNEMDWYIFGEPGWFLEQGWGLTPETAGISDRDGWGPHRRPSIGWIRRRSDESVMTIGGRHLGGDPPVNVAVQIDGRQIAAFDVKPGYFLETVRVPAGTIAGNGYAQLTVTAQAIGGGTTPPVAIEQFDFQPVDRVQFGYDEGWFEPEYNPRTGKSWRWMSERALLRVHNGGQPVTLRITGESPLHYFGDAPTVRISAGDRVLSELVPSSDFVADVSVPPDVLNAAGGRITVTSDRAFVAGEREGTADRRRLALRIYSAVVEAASR